jgi:predicted transcriptional regulator
MKDDYKIKTETAVLTVKIEAEVKKAIDEMASHSQHTQDEIVNTALKRFISSHKDFLPNR